MKILILGGTGSIGQALTKYITKTYHAHITILSNVEYEIWQMRLEYPELEYLLADIREFETEEYYTYVFNAAAIKHIDFCEQFPQEAVKTNICGLIKALHIPCKKFIHISSDKCVNASSVLGATKLIGERIALNAGATVIRLGNVKESRGSFFELLKRNGGIFPLTDERMKRYFIEPEAAAEFIYERGIAGGNHVYVPKMEESYIKDLVGPHVIVGVRKGEKLREELIGEYEQPFWEDGYWRL